MYGETLQSKLLQLIVELTLNKLNKMPCILVTATRLDPSLSHDNMKMHDAYQLKSCKPNS